MSTLAPAGNQRTRQTFTDGATHDYTYDPIGQLKIAGSSVAAEDRGYSYDTAWNVKYRTNSGTLQTFSVDSKNQLTSAPWPGYGSATLAYDANGNLTNAVFGAHPKQNYIYDDENRLIQLDNYIIGFNWRTVWTYDGLGRLRKRLEYGASTNLLSTTLYVYDGMRVIQERDGSNVPTVSYTRGSDLSAPLPGGAGGGLEGAGGIGGLLGRSDGYSAGNWTTNNVYHADGNGIVTYLLNSSQSKVAEYRYDAYGNTISSSGSLAAANVYRFSSKEIHVNGGLYYYGYRFYHPNLQRWLNRDPMASGAVSPIASQSARRFFNGPWEMFEGPNVYGFSRNAPVGFVDVNGLWTLGIGGHASYGFGFGGGLSIGIFVGYSKANGWSFGVLGGPFAGSGGPASVGAGGFVQVTSAKCVNQLKGIGGQTGGSGGEGLVLGGDTVFGQGYGGGEFNFGVGGGLPWEVHGGGTVTIGWDTDKGWK